MNCKAAAKNQYECMLNGSNHDSNRQELPVLKHKTKNMHLLLFCLGILHTVTFNISVGVPEICSMKKILLTF
jgi:hypothetical protein